MTSSWLSGGTSYRKISWSLEAASCYWSQWTHDVITTSLLRQTDTVKSFWRRNNDVIITLCVMLGPANCVSAWELQRDTTLTSWGHNTHTLITGVTVLQWRHNEPNGVSNHQPHDCLLNRLFRRGSKKTWKLRVTGLCEGNSPVTGEFPAQRASNVENVSIWWRHHVSKKCLFYLYEWQFPEISFPEFCSMLTCSVILIPNNDPIYDYLSAVVISGTVESSGCSAFSVKKGEAQNPQDAKTQGWGHQNWGVSRRLRTSAGTSED